MGSWTWNFHTSNAHVEDGARVQIIIATQGQHIPPDKGVSTGSWCPIAIS